VHQPGFESDENARERRSRSFYARRDSIAHLSYCNVSGWLAGCLS